MDVNFNPLKAGSRRDLLNREVLPLMKGSMLRTGIKDLSVSEALEAWQCLDLTEELIKDRKAEIRDFLLSIAERDGVETEKGGRQVDVRDAKVERQRRQVSQPNEESLLQLLKKRGLKASDIYDEVYSLQYNESKARHQVHIGKLSWTEIDALRPVTYALKVHKSPEWVDIFEEAVAGKKEQKVAPRKTPPRRSAY